MVQLEADSLLDEVVPLVFGKIIESSESMCITLLKIGLLSFDPFLRSSWIDVQLSCSQVWPKLYSSFKLAMSCHLLVKDLVRNGQPTFLANADGTCKTVGCQYGQVGRHPRHSRHADADDCRDEQTRKRSHGDAKIDVGQSSLSTGKHRKRLSMHSTKSSGAESHIYAVAEDAAGTHGSQIHCTAIVVGPRAVLSCSQSFNLSIKSVHRQYFLQRMFSKKEVVSNESRIPVTVHKYSGLDNWAVLLRSDGKVFETYARIHTACDSVRANVNQTAVLLHYPEKWPTSTCICNTFCIQTSSPLYVAYDASNATTGSAGGAMYLDSAPSEVFGLHIGHVAPGDDSHGVVNRTRLKQRHEVNADARKISACTGRALVISRFPQLIQVLEAVNGVQL